MTGTILTWSDWALRGIQNEFATEAPVRIFVMGTNQWRREREFPLQRQRLTRYHLYSVRGANSIRGDGELSTAMPGGEKPDIFEYDPANPTPTIGGRLCCCATQMLVPGPLDQSPNETRDDVLVFSIPTLAADVEVTDFTALLVDVDPSGYSRYLADGIVRGRYRTSRTTAELLVPGQIYRYEIDLWSTSNVFKAGHRIRLLVSSSNFPRFNRNLNTGEPLLGAAGMVRATQRIYHDGDHPSTLILPVISASSEN